MFFYESSRWDPVLSSGVTLANFDGGLRFGLFVLQVFLFGLWVVDGCASWRLKRQPSASYFLTSPPF